MVTPSAISQLSGNAFHSREVVWLYPVKYHPRDGARAGYILEVYLLLSGFLSANQRLGQFLNQEIINQAIH